MELTRTCSNVPTDLVESADLLFTRQTTFRVKLSFKQPDPTNPRNQIPLPIGTYTVSFHAVDIVDDVEVPVLEFSSTVVTANGSTINIIDAPNGVAEILITDEETTAITQDKLYWWLTIDPPNGDQLLRAKGIIKIINPY